MEKSISILLVVFLFSMRSFSQDTMLDYIKNAPTVSTFDGYSFVSEHDSENGYKTGAEYNFKIGAKPMVLDFSETIPIKVFNNFVKNNLYPRRPNNIYPVMIRVKGERDVDSIKVTSVGLIESTKLISGQTCSPRLIIIGKRAINNSKVEFLLLTDDSDGVYAELYVFDVMHDRILSYVPLFQGEKFDRQTCEPLGKNRVAAYQTTKISGGLITQSVNDSFNDTWVRRIRLNQDGYYELVWFDNPLTEVKVYSANINDVDGYTNVRRLPSAKSTILYTIKAGEVFQVEDMPSAKDWYKIYQYNNSYEGWIHKSRVKIIELIDENKH